MSRSCSIEGCDWVPEPGQWLRRGMCQKHYGQTIRGTLGMQDPDPLIDDDQVRGPGDLPILPKAVAHRSGWWAVVMPYPSFDGSQPCAEDPALWDEDDSDAPNSKGLRLAACKRCPFRVSCFEWGMAHEEYGTFGGANVSTREKLRKKRRQRLVTPQTGGDTFPERNWDEALKPRLWVEPDEEEEDWYGIPV